MFGVGPQEVVIIVVLLLVVFGPIKAASMARDFGRFVSEARGQVKEFKEELVPEEVDGVRRSMGEIKGELTSSGEGGGTKGARNEAPAA